MTDHTPEAPLWAMLDRLGLPFRHSAGELMARYGSFPDDWTDDFRNCFLPSAALLPDLARFSFRWRAGGDPTLPPEYIETEYRGAPWQQGDHVYDQRAERNFLAVTSALQTELGPGRDCGTPYDVAHRWDLGEAVVKTVAWPPRLHRHLDMGLRRQVDPESEHRCLLSIRPAWMPDLSAQQSEWVADFIPVGQLQMVKPPHGWHRFKAAPGIGLSRDGMGFVASIGNFVKVLPRADLIALNRDVCLPSRGGGGVYLTLIHAPAGLPELRPHRLQLYAHLYATDALFDTAQRLAQGLGLPVHETESLDF